MSAFHSGPVEPTGAPIPCPASAPAPAAPTAVDLTTGPFRTATALACGLTPRMLAGRRFTRLFRDVYVASDLADDPAVRAAGARLLAPHAVVGHETAARLWDLPMPQVPGTDDDPAGEPVHLLVLPGTPAPRRAGLVVHEVPIPSGDVATRHDLPVAVPARVLVDLAMTWCLGDLVALGDEALRRGLLDELDLARRVHDQSGRRGIAAARAVMQRLDGASPSPEASRTRVLLQSSDLPRPLHADGEVLCWPQYGVALDVRGGLESPADLVLRAWNLLRAHGWPAPRPRPLLHEGLAAIGAYRVRPSLGRPPGW